jgi:hypothetical protein
MAQFPEVLEWYSLTEMVNEFDSPASVLVNGVFSNVRTLTTENIVYRRIDRGRHVAPFVEPCAEAIMSGGYSESEITFSAPNIRIKRPLDACDLLFRRHAGDVVFADGSTQSEAAAREIALQLQTLNDEVANAEEWLAAQALRGVISYVTPDEAAYTINYNKPAANDWTVGTDWGTVGATPLADVKTSQRLMHTAVNLNPMTAYVGADACDAMLAESEIRELLDIRNMRAGLLDLTRGIQENGAMPLGSLFGIDFWVYDRQVSVGGTLEDLIRPTYIELVNTSSQAMNTLYYAGIADLDANDQGTIATRRFSKSWRQPDPSTQQVLVHSRPLPIMKRPGSVVSMEVV